MRRLITLCTILVFPVLAFAQPPTVASIRIDVGRGSSPDTITHQQTYAVTAALCNRTPSAPPAPFIINPTKVEWEDPINAGKACQVDATTFLNSLPTGDYLAKAYFVYSDGGIGGPSSSSNPFTRFTYTVPTGVRFVR